MASSQDSVSCDSCKVNNFKGLRHKCLICYDYDLCSRCHEAGLVSSRHKVSHPMQCFVARNDYDLFYSGEPNITDRPHSYTCPLCNQAGFTETSLTDHVHITHSTVDGGSGEDSGVVCPICSVESNQLTYDLGMHLTLEHKANPLRNILSRDQQQQSQLDPLQQSLPPPSNTVIRGRGARCHVRTASRGRRSHVQYGNINSVSPQHLSLSSISSHSTIREQANDPLVSEIISQLPTTRRAAGGGGNSSQNGNNSIIATSSALNQLHMQLQSTSSRISTDREIRIFRRTLQTLSNQMLLNGSGSNQAAAAPPPPPPPRPPGSLLAGLPSTAYSSGSYTMMPMMNQSFVNNGNTISLNCNNISNSQYSGPNGNNDQQNEVFNPQTMLSTQNPYQQQQQQLPTITKPHDVPYNSQLTPAQFLLPRCLNPNQTEADQAQHESLKADRSLFVQDLLLQFGTIEDDQDKF